MPKKVISTMEELLASQQPKPLNLVRGQVVKGEVVSVSDAEVILDLGIKSEGVIPTKGFPEDKLPKVGDQLEVYVIEPENESSQVELSLQPAQSRLNRDQKSPSVSDFAKLIEKYNPDNTFPGTVTNLTQFGVFVALEEGVEGLIHSSKVGVNTKYEVGQKIQVIVDSIEPEKQRIALSPVVTSTKDLIYK